MTICALRRYPNFLHVQKTFRTEDAAIEWAARQSGDVFAAIVAGDVSTDTRISVMWPNTGARRAEYVTPLTARA